MGSVLGLAVSRPAGSSAGLGSGCADSMGFGALSWALVLFLDLILTLVFAFFFQVLQTIERIFLFGFYPGDACSKIDAVGL